MLRNLALLLSCSSLLEHYVSVFLSKVSEKLSGYLGIAVGYVALESKNHENLLKKISKSLIAIEEVNETLCYKICGGYWRDTVNNLKSSIKIIEEISLENSKQIALLLKKNVVTETLTGEEIYVSSILPLISSLIKHNKIPHLNLILLIIEEIVKEEKYHLKILEKVINELMTSS